MRPIEFHIWRTPTSRPGWNDRPASRIIKLLPRVWHQRASALEVSRGLGHPEQLEPRRTDPYLSGDLQRGVQRRRKHPATWKKTTIGLTWRPQEISASTPALRGAPVSG